jgi:carboxyl-terminal processing protease
MIGISADDAVDLIRGPKDSVVELTILGAKESVEKNIKVKRDTVVVPTVQGEILTGTTIGYIEINMFGENTAKEFQKAFQKVLQDGATAIILDGRNNGGGFLDAAVDVLAEFLPENTIAVVTK